MAINTILYLSLALILTNFYVIANDVNATIKCQFGKPMRKQVPAEPLNGMCLRDATVHLSKTLQSIVDKELGVSKFQKMINKMEFIYTSSDLDIRLNSLVEKFNNKLKSYDDILKQSYKIIHPILSKKQDYSAYSSQMVNFDITQNRVTDICTEIITGIFLVE